MPVLELRRRGRGEGETGVSLGLALMRHAVSHGSAFSSLPASQSSEGLLTTRAPAAGRGEPCGILLDRDDDDESEWDGGAGQASTTRESCTSSMISACSDSDTKTSSFIRSQARPWQCTLTPFQP